MNIKLFLGQFFLEDLLNHHVLTRIHYAKKAVSLCKKILHLFRLLERLFFFFTSHQVALVLI